MYVITFYSFKGGVGRSMALVNVGVELARAGKSVLLVDFDLEAPSLTTFNIEAAGSCRQGVVDFVIDYLESDRAPDVRGYISQQQSFESDGRLWIMPAGSSGEDYQTRLARINWLDLYERRSGYLLMEEMKAQWEKALNPDYVLIDSRTGHSDVSGICTRQLPNAVAFVFVPNRQNLDGLAYTVGLVRSSPQPIATFFVESNVPYYDDERRTLEKNRRMFQERLGIDRFGATVHQHPHLSVLNQSVFVSEFPDTSLAGEYRKLTELVRGQNLGDRDVVVSHLRRMATELRFTHYYPEKKLKEISERHGNDAEICFLLGRISRQLGEDDAALIQFNQAIDRGLRTPEVLLERALLKMRKKSDFSGDEVAVDLRAALDRLAEGPKLPDVQLALRNLMSLTPGRQREFAELPAVKGLPFDAQVQLAYDLMSTDGACEFAYLVLRRLRDQCTGGVTKAAWANNFALACIRTKRFREALETLSEPLDQYGTLSEQARNFNRAIALWGETGQPPVADFNQVLRLDEVIPDRVADPNYHQCIAIAAYVCKDIGRALGQVDRAKRLAEQQPALHFSAWRYLKVSPKDFGLDCDQLREQISTEKPLNFPAIQAPAAASIH